MRPECSLPGKAPSSMTFHDDVPRRRSSVVRPRVKRGSLSARFSSLRRATPLQLSTRRSVYSWIADSVTRQQRVTCSASCRVRAYIIFVPSPLTLPCLCSHGASVTRSSPAAYKHNPCVIKRLSIIAHRPNNFILECARALELVPHCYKPRLEGAKCAGLATFDLRSDHARSAIN